MGSLIILGDVVGEPVAIPKQYIRCDVVKAASELICDAGNEERKKIHFPSQAITPTGHRQELNRIPLVE